MTNEEIFKELGLMDAPEENKQHILKNIVVVTEARLSALVDEMLTEDQAESLGIEIDKNDPETIAQWFTDNMPGASELYEALMREHVAELKEQLDQSPEEV